MAEEHLPIDRFVSAFGFFEGRRRAEIAARRTAMLQAEAKSLAAAQEYEALFEAAALRRARPEAREPRPGVCCAADQSMDSAAGHLQRGEFADAIGLFESAAKTYCQAGAAAGWDVADAYWNLGYASAAEGSMQQAADCLKLAGTLLASQRRLRSWAQCTITLLAVRAALGEGELPECQARDASRLAARFGWPRELLRMTLLTAFRLADTGKLQEAQALLTKAERLAGQAGERGCEDLRQATRIMSELNRPTASTRGDS